MGEPTVVPYLLIRAMMSPLRQDDCPCGRRFLGRARGWLVYAVLARPGLDYGHAGLAVERGGPDGAGRGPRGGALGDRARLPRRGAIVERGPGAPTGEFGSPGIGHSYRPRFCLTVPCLTRTNCVGQGILILLGLHAVGDGPHECVLLGRQRMAPHGAIRHDLLGLALREAGWRVVLYGPAQHALSHGATACRRGHPLHGTSSRWRRASSASRCGPDHTGHTGATCPATSRSPRPWRTRSPRARPT